MKSYLQKKLHKSLYDNAYSRAFYTQTGVVIKEIQCAFKQFYSNKYPLKSMLNVVRAFSSSILRFILGRSLKFSFAFTGEDRIIEGIIKPKINESGFYVEVGCNHPKFLSNTYGLYKKGWKGLCIDANESLIKKFRLQRPKDIAVCAVISNEVKDINFFQIENDVLSTLDESNLEEAIKVGLSYRSSNRKTTTLTSVLKQYNVQSRFDILSIDAEEHDYEVLSSLNFSLYHPKLIIVEDEDFNFSDYSNNRFVKFLKGKKYKMVGYVLKNAYFMPQWS